MPQQVCLVLERVFRERERLCLGQLPNYVTHRKRDSKDYFENLTVIYEGNTSLQICRSVQ